MNNWSYDPANYSVGDYLWLTEGGTWRTTYVARYVVTHKTPKGQVVVKRGEAQFRLTPRGHIVGEGEWSRRCVISEKTAREHQEASRIHRLWNEIRTACAALDKAAQHEDAAAAPAALTAIMAACAAQGIEAGAGETEQLDPKGESPVANGDAPEPSAPAPHPGDTPCQ